MLVDIQNLIDELNEICLDLDNKYRINSGGCCYVAAEIARNLDKLKIKYELKIFDSYDKNLEIISREVKTKHSNSTIHTSVTGLNTCNHYFIHINNYGSINSEEEIYYDANVYSIENIRYTNIKWIYDYGIWNNDYETIHNSIIRNKINSCFKKYKELYEN